VCIEHPELLLLFWRSHPCWPAQRTQVHAYTFGSPRVGNLAFTQFFQVNIVFAAVLFEALGFRA
jgi:hypothetical protein